MVVDAVRPLPSEVAVNDDMDVPSASFESELCSSESTDLSEPTAVSCVLSAVCLLVSAAVCPATFALTSAETSEFTSIVEFVEPLMIDCAACCTALFGSTVVPDVEVVATVVMCTPFVACGVCLNVGEKRWVFRKREPGDELPVR
ncbi:protein of unknown function [Caballeronia sp. S22]